MKKQKIQQSLPSLLKFFKHILPYLRQKRLLIALSVAAMIAEIALRLLEPWPLKWVFDRLSSQSNGQLEILKSLDTTQLLIVAAVAVVIFSGLRALADYFNTVGFTLVGNHVVGEIRTDAYRHLQRLPLSFHTRAKSGDMVLRLTGDITMLKDIAVSAALPLIVNFMVLASMIVVMFWLNWKLALISFACLPIFWLSTIRTGKKIRETARKNRKRQGRMAATVSESITAIKVIQALGLERAFGSAFSNENSKTIQEDVASAKLSARLGRTVDLLTAVATALVLWYGARLVLGGNITAGDLIVFLTYLKRAYKPIQDQAKYTARMSKAAASAERVLEILNITPEIRDVPGAVKAAPFAGEIRFESVRFGYEPNIDVLKTVNLNILKGEHVALVGASGIGKSTIVNLLFRFYDPQQGRVLIDGRDIREYTLESLRSQISVVLQDNMLFGASVRDNIVFGAHNSSDERVMDAAKLANAHDFIEALPEGYNTILGERGATLSNGQRQRIAIARAAIRESAILILDEPTIGLDEENERAVIEALERLATHRTTFLITHDLMLASRMDKIVYLEEGSVLEQGTHFELIKNQGRYATLFLLQTESLREIREVRST